MVRKMLILGALPLPAEGTWVPIGSGQWTCEVDRPLLGMVRIDVEDVHGSVHSFVPSETQGLFSGRRVRAVILEEISAVDIVHVGIRKVA